MKLYRGYKEKPEILDEKLENEWNELNTAKQAASEGTKNPIDVINRMGSERFGRWAKLAKIAGSQFFTDDEEMARGFAGEKGFLIVVDISDEIAGEHYSGDQIMAREGKPRPISNFVFSGKELARISKDGNANIIDLEIERRSKEGRADSLEVNPFRTIRGNDDLSEKDRSALEDIRRTISDGHEGKPPKA